jgi:hypothetical protein
MAKINEDMVVIKVSELLKDDAQVDPIMNDEVLSGLEAIVAELVGAGKLIEIIRE